MKGTNKRVAKTRKINRARKRLEALSKSPPQVTESRFPQSQFSPSRSVEIDQVTHDTVLLKK